MMDGYAWNLDTPGYWYSYQVSPCRYRTRTYIKDLHRFMYHKFQSWIKKSQMRYSTCEGVRGYELGTSKSGTFMSARLHEHVHVHSHEWYGNLVEYFPFMVSLYVSDLPKKYS